MKINKDDIQNFVNELNALELNELLEAIKDKLAADASALGNTTSAPDDNEKKSGYSVSLDAVGAHKVWLIKAVRELRGAGLKGGQRPCR